MIQVSALVEKYAQLQPYAKKRRLDGGYVWVYDFGPTENQCLLAEITVREYFGLHSYTLRRDRLCPRIPNRLEYMKLVEGHLTFSAEVCRRIFERPQPKTIVDVGTGASLIYPIVGRSLSPQAEFVCSEVDPESVKAAKEIILQNGLANVKVQQTAFFPEVTGDVWYTVCNPPFYGSEKEMKVRAMGKAVHSAALAISASESIYEGGEVAFIKEMIDRSKDQPSYEWAWFSSQVGIQSHVKEIERYLAKKGAEGVWKGCIGFGTSRWIIAWNWQGMRGLKIGTNRGCVEKYERLITTGEGKIETFNQQPVFCARRPFWLRKERRHPGADDGWKLLLFLGKKPHVIYNSTPYDDVTILNGLDSWLARA